MIGFILFLIQASAFATTKAPGCGELSRISSELEKDIQTSYLKECRDLDLGKLITTSLSSQAIEIFNDNKCAPLYQIETKIADLENQEALLLGFEKLKNQIQTTHESLSEEKKQEQIKKNASEFAQALNTAQTIESLLSSEVPSVNNNFMQLLAAEKSDLWDTNKKFTELVAKFCEKLGKDGNLNVCSSDFRPNDQTHAELRQMLRTGSLSKEESDQWKKALTIQKNDGSIYTFTMMTDAIQDSYTKLLKGETLNATELSHIKALEKFKSSPQFSFVKKLPAPSGNSLIHSKIKSHIESLKKRQEVELNTKMSFVASINKDILTNEELQSCSSVNMLSELDSECSKGLKKATERLKSSAANDQISQLSEAVKSFEKGESYLAKLSKLSSVCESNITECAQNLPENLANITENLSALRLIKEKIGSQKTQEMAFRNFAITKLNINCSNSLNTQKSIVEECNDTLSEMAPEMYRLSNSLMDISLMVDPKNIKIEDENIKKLCENEDVAKKVDQKKLCAFLTDKVSDELPKAKDTKDDPEAYMASVDAPKGNDKNRQAWVNGIGTVANALVDTWLSGQQSNNPYFNNINPYNYNYGPYNATGAMSTSDAILFNARYYGSYGFYMPTMGLQPYTTFGSGTISSYSPLPQTGGAVYGYFGK